MHPSRRAAALAALAALAVLLAACGDADRGAPERASTVESPAPTVTTTTSTTTPAPTTTEPRLTRPAWLGTRVLPLRPDGFGQVLPTPAELDPRHLPSPAHLPSPGDGRFHASVSAVPADVVQRSTWQAACPVALDDLRYVTVSFWGFDDRPHTGELLVHRDAAQPLAGVFEQLFAARFPIEEMRITRPDELDAPPTGDGNNTGAFVCRPTRGSTSWSQHAYGLAIDINPFHNPYVKDDLVLPELASTYVDRSDVRPGMIVGGPVVDALAAIGWEWGGAWDRPTDPMHFSANGR